MRAAIESGSRGRLGRLEELQQTLRECEDAIIGACAPRGPPAEPSGARSSVCLPGGGPPSVDAQTLLGALLEPEELPPTAAQAEMAATLLRIGERRGVGAAEAVWHEDSAADYFVYVLEGESSPSSHLSLAPHPPQPSPGLLPSPPPP